MILMYDCIAIFCKRLYDRMKVCFLSYLHGGGAKSLKYNIVPD